MSTSTQRTGTLRHPAHVDDDPAESSLAAGPQLLVRRAACSRSGRRRRRHRTSATAAVVAAGRRALVARGRPPGRARRWRGRPAARGSRTQPRARDLAGPVEQPGQQGAALAVSTPAAASGGDRPPVSCRPRGSRPDRHVADVHRQLGVGLGADRPRAPTATPSAYGGDRSSASGSCSGTRVAHPVAGPQPRRLGRPRRRRPARAWCGPPADRPGGADGLGQPAVLGVGDDDRAVGELDLEARPAGHDLGRRHDRRRVGRRRPSAGRRPRPRPSSSSPVGVRERVSSASALPTAGRAARTIIWPGCSPLVSSSKSANPVGTPTISPPREPIASISSRAPSMIADSGR